MQVQSQTEGGKHGEEEKKRIRGKYQSRRGEVSFGTGDYAVFGAVCLGLCRETQHTSKLRRGQVKKERGRDQHAQITHSHKHKR